MHKGATLELCSGSGAFSEVANKAGYYPNITLNNRSTGPSSLTICTGILHWGYRATSPDRGTFALVWASPAALCRVFQCKEDREGFR